MSRSAQRSVVGLALAASLVRAAGGALLGAPSLDIRAIVFVAACGVALAIAGALGPAQRASRVNVGELLRLE